MPGDQGLSFPEVRDWTAPIDFLERVKQLGLSGGENPSLLAIGLLHKSGKHELKLVENYEGHFLEFRSALAGLGKAIVDLYVTDYLCDSKKYVTAGEISVAVRHKILDLKGSFGKALGLPVSAIFGFGITEDEKQSDRIIHELACQCIGGLYFSNGLKEITRVLSSFPAQKTAVSVNHQDYKTPLQEYTQRNGLKVPIYETLEVTGPAHKQSFRVRVSTKDAKSAEGEGLSKKLAGQNAAENYLLNYAPTILKPKQKKKELGVRGGAILKYPGRDDRFIENLAANFDLPSAGVNDMALALRHKSVKLDQSYDQGLGCDNQILSLLGSVVQQWVSWDFVVRQYFHLDRRQSLGGELTNFVKEVLPAAPTSEIFDLLNLKAGLLLRGGQTSNLEVSIRSDAVQSVMAVLYRHRKNRCEFGADLIESRVGEIQSWLNVKVQKVVTKNRDSAIPVKTLFQEKCQALGLTVDYCTKTISSKFKKLILVPRIGVLHNETPVHYFELPQEISESRKSSEGAFAKTLMRALDFGCEKDIDHDSPEGSIVVEGRKVFLEYLLQIIEKDALTALPLEKTVLHMGALGTRLLIAGNHRQFCDWVGKSENLLGHSIESPKLVEFYKRCGRVSDTVDSGLDYLGIFLPKALELLHLLEPGSYRDEIKRTGFLDETNVIGKIFRLKNSDIQIKAAQEILDDLELIFGNRFQDFEVFGDEVQMAEYLERPGSVVELMNEVSGILSRASVNRENTSVSLTFSETGIRFQVTWLEGVVTCVVLEQLFNESKLFHFLRDDLELRDFNISDCAINFVILSGFDNSSWQFACKLIFSFHEGQSIRREAYELIASRLHDFKNELVAFQVAANSSQKTEVRSEKYRLAYSASKHADNAENIIILMSRVAGASATKSISVINVQEFFREIVGEIMSWAPTSVVVVPPENLDDALMETDPTMLRTILINLCKNGIEAMQSKGRLALEWVFDPDREVLELEIVDSAGAMLPETCERLNEGLLPSSTKDGGSGVGLLTVGLMLRSLGGKAMFTCEAGIQTRIDLVIPSLFDEVPLSEQSEK
jgi:dsRNA-specific ribonuclease/signal transduction histidine kinase